MHRDHTAQNDLIIDIFLQLANEKNKSLEHIKRLLLIEENTAINSRFWELLDERLQNHSFEYVGCCAKCGSFELR